MKVFKQHLQCTLDDKFWSSIVARSWTASFLDRSFRQLAFVPQRTSAELCFNRNLINDLDWWILAEMTTVAQKLKENLAGYVHMLRYISIVSFTCSTCIVIVT